MRKYGTTERGVDSTARADRDSSPMSIGVFVSCPPQLNGVPFQRIGRVAVGKMLRLQLLALAGASRAVAEQVFMAVDSGVVAEAERSAGGWTAVVPPAEKEPKSPLMAEKEIWEVRWDNTYPTTRWDEAMGRFRMWYGASLTCDRVPKPGDARPNKIDGCGHPTWHQQFPDQVPWQTAEGESGILYAESTDGLSWVKLPRSPQPRGRPPHR